MKHFPWNAAESCKFTTEMRSFHQSYMRIVGGTVSPGLLAPFVMVVFPRRNHETDMTQLVLRSRLARPVAGLALVSSQCRNIVRAPALSKNRTTTKFFGSGNPGRHDRMQEWIGLPLANHRHNFVPKQAGRSISKGQCQQTFKFKSHLKFCANSNTQQNTTPAGSCRHPAPRRQLPPQLLRSARCLCWRLRGANRRWRNDLR